MEKQQQKQQERPLSVPSQILLSSLHDVADQDVTGRELNQTTPKRGNPSNKSNGLQDQVLRKSANGVNILKTPTKLCVPLPSCPVLKSNAPCLQTPIAQLQPNDFALSASLEEWLRSQSWSALEDSCNGANWTSSTDSSLDSDWSSLPWQSSKTQSTAENSPWTPSPTSRYVTPTILTYGDDKARDTWLDDAAIHFSGFGSML